MSGIRSLLAKATDSVRGESRWLAEQSARVVSEMERAWPVMRAARERILTLESALRPFAKEVEMYEECDDAVHLFAIDEDGEKSEIDICVGDLRRAHDALACDE